MRTIGKAIIGILLAASLVFSIPFEASAAVVEAAEIHRILNAAEIMTFDAGGSFQANSPLTRAQLAKILVSASPYKGLAGDASRISPFKDVPFTHWGAAHIAVARDSGLVRGYADGSFKPDQNVLYEEAVTAVLNLLGFTLDDYSGSYPAAPIAKARSMNLLDGVAGSLGAPLTRGGTAQLVYNALHATPNGGIRTAAEMLGYTLSTNVLSLGDVIADNSRGPITYKGEVTLLNLGMDDPIIYRNGNLASLSTLQLYDVLYYNTSTNTVWVHSKKTSGLLVDVLPNRESPTSIIVSGETLKLSSPAAVSSVGLDGIAIGQIVTALLDRDGNVADVYQAGLINGSMYGVVTAAQVKSLPGPNGDVASHTVTVVLLDKSVIDLPVGSDRSNLVGQAVRVEIRGGSASVSVADENGVSGTVSASRRRIGEVRIAADVAILDVNTYGNTAFVSMERIDGLSLSTSQVLGATRNRAGEVDGLILKDVTGESFSYGAFTEVNETDRANANAQGQTSSVTLSGRYTYLIGGRQGMLNTSDRILRVYRGPAVFALEGSTVVWAKNLTQMSGSIESVNAANITLTNGARCRVSGNVTVYDDSGAQLRFSSIDELMVANPESIRAYYNKPLESGGAIHVIVYR